MKKNETRKRREIGVFTCGHENVRLWVDLDLEGGWFRACPDDKGMPIICIGFKNNKWPAVVGILVHEAMEFALSRRHARYEQSLSLSRDTGAFMFVFGHDAFTESCDNAGEFIATSSPELATAFNKFSKRKK